MRTRFTAKQKGQQRKDWLLLVVLLGLNLWSGSTTIEGSIQVLGNKSIAIIGGIAIQLILFFLLAGWMMKDSQVRKMLAITILAFASIYTSFFSYHQTLTSDIRLID
jgi:hypothetical protein